MATEHVIAKNEPAKFKDNPFDESWKRASATES